MIKYIKRRVDRFLDIMKEQTDILLQKTKNDRPPTPNEKFSAFAVLIQSAKSYGVVNFRHKSFMDEIVIDFKKDESETVKKLSDMVSKINNIATDGSRNLNTRMVEILELTEKK